MIALSVPFCSFLGNVLNFNVVKCHSRARSRAMAMAVQWQWLVKAVNWAWSNSFERMMCKLLT